MPTRVPSLDLLQVFEACARRLSFTAAGAELGMTQPAVSQHMQRLEHALGTGLFLRVHRGIVPTAAGISLLGPVQEALALIDEAVRAAVAEPARTVLAVATDFAFAAYWLMPRLERFYRSHPGVDVSLVTSNRALVSLPADVDLAIVFGDGRIQRGDAELLLAEQVYPVCSPSLMQRHGGDPQSVLQSSPRLHLKPAPGQRWFDWDQAGRAWGLNPQAERAPPSFDNYPLVVGAAMAGHGVAIGWHPLVKPLIDQGLLCRLREDLLASSLGYHLVLPQRKLQLAGARDFVQWLRNETRAPSEPTLDSGHV